MKRAAPIRFVLPDGRSVLPAAPQSDVASALLYRLATVAIGANTHLETQRSSGDEEGRGDRQAVQA
jgi:hypothetical protein